MRSSFQRCMNGSDIRIAHWGLVKRQVGHMEKRRTGFDLVLTRDTRPHFACSLYIRKKAGTQRQVSTRRGSSPGSSTGIPAGTSSSWPSHTKSACPCADKRLSRFANGLWSVSQIGNNRVSIQKLVEELEYSQPMSEASSWSCEGWEVFLLVYSGRHRDCASCKSASWCDP